MTKFISLDNLSRFKENCDEAYISTNRVWKITSISTIYEDVSSLPTEGVENGTVFVAKTNGSTPYCMYSYNVTDGVWEYVDDIRGKTIYIVQQDNYHGDVLFHFKSCDNKFYPLFIENHTLISNTATIHENLTALQEAVPNPGNGYVAPVKTNGGLPVVLYSYDANAGVWIYKGPLTNQGIYIDLKTNDVLRFNPAVMTFSSIFVNYYTKGQTETYVISKVANAKTELKEYVDTSIANAITQALGGSY